MTMMTGVITHGELTAMKETFVDDVTQMVKLPTWSGQTQINLFGDSNGNNGSTKKVLPIDDAITRRLMIFPHTRQCISW